MARGQRHSSICLTHTQCYHHPGCNIWIPLHPFDAFDNSEKVVKRLIPCRFVIHICLLSLVLLAGTVVAARCSLGFWDHFTLVTLMSCGREMAGFPSTPTHCKMFGLLFFLGVWFYTDVQLRLSSAAPQMRSRRGGGTVSHTCLWALKADPGAEHTSVCLRAAPASLHTATE